MVHYFLSSDGIFLDFFPQLASIASNPETSNLQQQPGCAFTVWSHHPFVDSSKSSSFQQGTNQFSSWGSPLAPFSRLLLSLWIANLLSNLWSNPPSSTFRFAADILHPFTSIANKVGVSPASVSPWRTHYQLDFALLTASQESSPFLTHCTEHLFNPYHRILTLQILEEPCKLKISKNIKSHDIPSLPHPTGLVTTSL